MERAGLTEVGLSPAYRTASTCQVGIDHPASPVRNGLPNNGLELTSAKHHGGVGSAGTDRSGVLGRVKGQARCAAPSAPLTRPARGA